MEQRLTAAFTEFLARNRKAGGRPGHHGVRVDGAAEDGSAFDLTLTFLPLLGAGGEGAGVFARQYHELLRAHPMNQ